jgi:TPR repeat protein
MSFIWISMAAKSGFDKAQYNLVEMFRDGRGVAKDTGSAAKWFLSVAELGYPKAQRNIGTRFMCGDGLEWDDAKALMWLSLAANGGDSGAVEKRDAVAGILSAAERKSIDAMVQSWKPSSRN